MKKKFKKIITSMLSMLLCLSITIPVYAEYDADEYEHTNETWTVTNNHGAPNTCILYTVIQDKYSGPGTLHSFSFDCIDAEFSTGETFAGMDCPYYSDNPIETLEIGKVFQTQFGIEPGTYVFIGGSGNTVLGFDLETSPLNLPDAQAYSNYENLQTVTVTNGDVLHIYALRGDLDWTRESYDQFLVWALQKEKQFDKLMLDNSAALEETEEIIEPTYTSLNDGNHNYTFTNSDGKLVIQSEPCTYNANKCIYCNYEKVEIPVEVPEEIEVEEEPEEKNIWPLIIGIVLFIGAMIVAKLRKK